MDTDRAIEIVQSLADLSAVCLRATRRQVSQAGGVDPFSGERFPSGSSYQQADTVRTLHLALACRVVAFRRRRKGLTKLRRVTPRKTAHGRECPESNAENAGSCSAFLNIPLRNAAPGSDLPDAWLALSDATPSVMTYTPFALRFFQQYSILQY